VKDNIDILKLAEANLATIIQETNNEVPSPSKKQADRKNKMFLNFTKGL
jgi:hypothetical protein